ncbi:MAG: hypothetical protein UF433_13345 [Clostridium sp.]|nr:hypothetical protein [Clostridium sp.]
MKGDIDGEKKKYSQVHVKIPDKFPCAIYGRGDKGRKEIFHVPLEVTGKFLFFLCGGGYLVK